jgi:hypothetical protein
LHGAILFFSGGWDGGVGVINPGALDFPLQAFQGICPEFGGILDRLKELSSPFADLGRIRDLKRLHTANGSDSLRRTHILTLFSCHCL